MAFALKEQINFLRVDIFRQNGWSKLKYSGCIWAIYIAIYRLAKPICNYIVVSRLGNNVTVSPCTPLARILKGLDKIDRKLTGTYIWYSVS